MPQLVLQRFDPSSIGPGTVVVLIGKRDCGISYLLCDLMWPALFDVPVAPTTPDRSERRSSPKAHVPP